MPAWDIRQIEPNRPILIALSTLFRYQTPSHEHSLIACSIEGRNQ